MFIDVRACSGLLVATRPRTWPRLATWLAPDGVAALKLVPRYQFTSRSLIQVALHSVAMLPPCDPLALRESVMPLWCLGQRRPCGRSREEARRAGGRDADGGHGEEVGDGVRGGSRWTTSSRPTLSPQFPSSTTPEVRVMGEPATKAACRKRG